MDRGRHGADVKNVAIARHGGGAHASFTWLVLQATLKRKKA